VRAIQNQKQEGEEEEEGERGKGDIVATQTERKAERRETANERSKERLFVRKYIPSGYRSNRFRAFFFRCVRIVLRLPQQVYSFFIFPLSLSLSLQSRTKTTLEKAMTLEGMGGKGHWVLR
jgi:hypothetical protein